MEFLPLLIICAACIARPNLCVRLHPCKISNPSFIDSNAARSRSPEGKGLPGRVGRSAFPNADELPRTNSHPGNAESDNLVLQEPDSRLMLDVSSNGSLHFRPTIGAAMDALAPCLLRILEARRALGCAPLPSLVCCSGGVDSMSLLHTLGLIKRNHRALIEKYTPLSHLTRYQPFPKGHPGYSPFIKENLARPIAELFENLEVVYFNHRQREDVDRDIAVIEEACKKYGFKLSVKEIPDSALTMKDGRKAGLQDAFRQWRRTTCLKILDEIAPPPPGAPPGGDYREGRPLEVHSLFADHIEGIKETSDLQELSGFVFMAHHLDDNLETLLLKIIRGTFLSNLTPMELYDRMDHKSVLLVRPFINLKKSELASFMKDLNASFNEDSSNSKLDYVRNVLRNLALPTLVARLVQTRPQGGADCPEPADSRHPSDLFTGLGDKFSHLARQCSNFQSLLQREVDAYFEYQSSKHGPNDFRWTPRGAGAAPRDATLRRAYAQFYDTILAGAPPPFEDRFDRSFTSNVRYLRQVGLRVGGYLHLKDWRAIPHRLVREQVLNRFVTESGGSALPYSQLLKLHKVLYEAPFSQDLKLRSVGPNSLHHQGYVIKFRPNGNLPRRADPPRRLVHSDDLASFYSCLEGADVRVNSGSPGFQLALTLAPGPAPVAPYGSSARPLFGPGRVELVVRLLTDKDIVPSKRMWSASALRILTNIGIQKILKQELPVLALAGTNHVIGIYGLNLSPPYFNRDRQTLEFQTHQVKAPRTYQIKIS